MYELKDGDFKCFMSRRGNPYIIYFKNIQYHFKDRQDILNLNKATTLALEAINEENNNE